MMRGKLRRFFRPVLSLTLALTMVAGLSAYYGPAARAIDDVVGTRRYNIDSPYATVDWDTWGQYRGNLHTHSRVSDGKEQFDAMIEEYYKVGYDVLAMTDHGTVNYGWDKKPDVHFNFKVINAGHNPEKHYLKTERKMEIYNGVG